MLNDRYDFSQALATKADAYDMQEILKTKASVLVTDNLQSRMNNVERSVGSNIVRTSDVISFINEKICPVIRIEAMQ